MKMNQKNKEKTQKKLKSNISSGTSSKNYICLNNNIKLSNDSLKMHLNNAYERGRSDEEKFNFGKIYPSCFSVSITFLIAYLTCDKYKSIFGISSDFMPYIIFAIFVLSFIIAIFSICYNKSKKTSVMTKSRDESVDNIIRNIKLVIEENDATNN